MNTGGVVAARQALGQQLAAAQVKHWQDDTPRVTQTHLYLFFISMSEELACQYNGWF